MGSTVFVLAFNFWLGFSEALGKLLLEEQRLQLLLVVVDSDGREKAKM